MAIEITSETLGVADDDSLTRWEIDDVFMLIVAISAFICLALFIITIHCDSKRRKRIRSDDDTLDIADGTDDKIIVKQVETPSSVAITFSSASSSPRRETSWQPKTTIPQQNPSASEVVPQPPRTVVDLEASPQTTPQKEAPQTISPGRAARSAADPPSANSVLNRENLEEASGRSDDARVSNIISHLLARPVVPVPRVDESKSEEEEEMTEIPINIPPQNQPPQDTTQDVEAPEDGGKKDPVCAICGKKFSDGDIICQSNNPKCPHQFHQACMIKWLRFQNRCPVCNETYVIPK